MHSRLNWWTEESINWFVRASGRSDYHRLLCDAIEPLLAPCRTVLEFGCGLGYEAEILKRRGFDINAYDIDEMVIRSAKARSGLDIFHLADVNQAEASADALLCINYGHIETEGQLESLLSHVERKLIYVISRHSAHNTDTREDRTQAIEDLLERCNLNFSKKEMALQFDQPLLSVEEARAFIDWTYLGKNTERYMSFVEMTEDEKFPFVFRNRKELVLFSVETKERRK